MLLKKLKFELPVEFLKRWLVIANEDKFTTEQISEDFPRFEDDLKWQLVRDQIVKDRDIKVEAAEIKAQARATALMQFRHYGIMDVPDENLDNYAAEMLKQEDEIRKIHDRLLEQKVMEALKETVRVDNKQITLEKFRKLFENS
jgi:trigger factor